MPSCPKDEASWREAARKMNCESVTQNCASKSHKFQYHCLMNSHMNATVEVCALSRIIFGTVPSLIIVVYITTECKVNFFSNCVQLYLKFGSIFDFYELGYCAEFDINGALVQENYSAHCKTHNPPCPEYYDSAKTYNCKSTLFINMFIL